MKKDFCESLRRLRGERSQSEFAIEIGTKQTTYSSWENGTREPDINTLCRIAAVTGTTPNELLGFSPPPPDRSRDKVADLKKVIITLLKEY